MEERKELFIEVKIETDQKKEDRENQPYPITD